MKNKWTPFLIWVIVISVFSGIVMLSLVATVILLFTYMYNVLREETERRTHEREFNEYLRVTGRLN